METPAPSSSSRNSRLHALSPSPLSPMPRKSGSQQGDRFIPCRGAMDVSVANFNLLHEIKENGANSALEAPSPVKEEYRRMLAENLLYDSSPRSPKVLSFKKREVSSTTASLEQCFSNLEICESPTKALHRPIKQTPERILDAPELVDDYYLNLLDWSCTNLVAVALGSAVYLWDAQTCATQLLSKAGDDDMVTSIAWAEDGRHIAVGINSAEVHVVDVKCLRRVRTLRGHSSRVSCLAWNGATLSSGSRDNTIINHDVRARNYKAAVLSGHSQEVCGLKWSPSGQQLASGGNDNLLYIWDAAMTSSSSSSESSYTFRMNSHQAAVKALAWCPFQAHLLASGGGTADRCIKFWNTQTGACLNSIDTSSQVCALQWNRHQKEILSSHGYSLNQLCVWKYPSMVKIAELTGHTARVLHLAQSPDGSTIVSAAADETLRFWKPFHANKKETAKTNCLLRTSSIR